MPSGRGYRGAEDRCADLWNGFAREFSHHRQAAHVGCLALIGGHAQCGVAFEMLDRTKALLVAELDVFDGHIVLLVKPRAAAPSTYQNGVMLVGASSACGIFGARAFDAKVAWIAAAAFAPVVNAACGRKVACRGSGDGHARRQFALGTKAAMSSFHVGRPRWWQVMMHIRVPAA